MTSILITGVSSDSGKTTFTMGFLELLKMNQKKVASFKIGPDYIDPMFHQHITENPCYNLPAWMVPDETLPYLYQKRFLPDGINVIEGVMGYFDGRHTDSIEGSSAQIASLLNVPVLLIVDGSKTALTAAAIVKGLCDFTSPNKIKGVVFNKVNSETHYNLLKDAVERHTSVKCYGYLPLVKESQLKSRHLGLVQAIEVDALDDKVRKIAEQMAKTVAWESILEDYQQLFSQKKMPQIEAVLKQLQKQVEEMPLALGVAKDESFAFYYEENLKTLEEVGVVLKPFSPLHDAHLPEGIQGLYLGGGYPEVFAKSLSENESMRKSILNFATQKKPIYAECGGLMYLCEQITTLEGDVYPMVGALEAKAIMTERLQHFGLVEATLTCKEDAVVYRAHEFHRSKIEGYQGSYVISVERKGKTWDCGYHSKQILATYAHNHFYSNLGFLDFLISFWSQRKSF